MAPATRLDTCSTYSLSIVLVLPLVAVPPLLLAGLGFVR